MLTARRDERDVIEGLELGADDYVSKPFSLSELSARIKALLRRSRRRGVLGAVLDIGPLKIDMEAQEAKLNGNALDLSPTEYKLLEVLARNEGRTLSRDELLAKVWGTTLGDSRTVDVHIWRLRHKLADDGDVERFIQTVRGRGYRLRFERKERENA
jgi:two-component system alkaline phosphatase synthesis response regulator PhoP